MMPLAWLLLCWPLFGKGHARFEAIGAVIKDALKALGPMTRPELRIGLIFGLVAIAWMTRTELVKLPGLGALSDTGVAIFGALLLFFVPSGRGNGEKLIDWKTAERIPWGIAILFGGGLPLPELDELRVLLRRRRRAHAQPPVVQHRRRGELVAVGRHLRPLLQVRDRLTDDEAVLGDLR